MQYIQIREINPYSNFCYEYKQTARYEVYQCFFCIDLCTKEAQLVFNVVLNLRIKSPSCCISIQWAELSAVVPVVILRAVMHCIQFLEPWWDTFWVSMHAIISLATPHDILLCMYVFFSVSKLRSPKRAVAFPLALIIYDKQLFLSSASSLCDLFENQMFAGLQMMRLMCRMMDLRKPLSEFY